MSVQAAEALGAGLVAVALAVDVPLIRNGRMSLSEASRRTIARRIFVTVTALHLLGVLGPLDPYSWAARRLQRSTP